MFCHGSWLVFKVFLGPWLVFIVFLGPWLVFMVLGWCADSQTDTQTLYSLSLHIDHPLNKYFWIFFKLVKVKEGRNYGEISDLLNAAASQAVVLSQSSTQATEHKGLVFSVSGTKMFLFLLCLLTVFSVRIPPSFNKDC